MVEHQMVFSPERKKQWSHNEYSEPLILSYLIINIKNLLTLLAADPPSSCPEWLLLHFSSCFPYLCLFPTNSSSQSKVGRAPHPPLSADQFQEILVQATAHFFARHNTVVPSFSVTVKCHEVSLPCS
jgi:hypothetical protein